MKPMLSGCPEFPRCEPRALPRSFAGRIHLDFTSLRILLFGILTAYASGQSTCGNFPPAFVPFSSIYYVTAADAAGDHLVVGAPAPGTLASIGANIPLPAFPNQTFCDAQVQLAPQQYYPSVYVPTAAELTGNFSDFSGLLVNPTTNQPYANGVIPGNQLGTVFAWRVGAPQAQSAHANWAATGSMSENREGSTSVLPPGGKVLLVSVYDTLADLYDPGTGTFSPTGQMQFSHGNGLSATTLNDGRVLIVGGSSLPSAAELFDPVLGQFTAIGAPLQPHGNANTGTLLQDGRVLIVGGLNIPGFGIPTAPADDNSGAELFDPVTLTFKVAGPMSANRNNHTATLLADGRVLIAGGNAEGGATATFFDSAEIFDPATGAFKSTSPMHALRAQHFAVLLSNGKVLVGGGFGDGTGSAELFDPLSASFQTAGSMVNPSRAHSTATLLSSGQVLVAGGINFNGTIDTNSAELYDPSKGSFSLTGSMTATRGYASATLLLDGRVLVSGGFSTGALNAVASAEIYTPTVEGLITSQSGLTFQLAQGNTSPVSQTVEVLSNTTAIPWNVSLHAYEGGNWLSAAPSSGNSVPGAAPANLVITVNPSGLAPQDYYGAVTLSPTDGIHPAVSIAIVLHIVPAGTAAPPAVSPTGLVFLGAPGATLNAQNFNITNLTSSAIKVSGVASNAPKFFSFAPASGTIPAASTMTFTVTPSVTGLTAGVYNGTITLTFGDGSTQTVQLLLVLSTSPGSTAALHPHATTACTPSRLLPVFTTIGAGFSAPAAWPTPIVVDVVDDCGNGLNTGSVVVSFTNGDPPINLVATGKGAWAGTWVPQHNTSGFTVRADAQALPLSGSVAVTGQVLSNPTVPVVSPGGVVSSGDFASAPAVGLLVSIFGSGLADSPVSAGLPMPPSLGSTSVYLSGSTAPLPLLYAADGLINVQFRLTRR